MPLRSLLRRNSWVVAVAVSAAALRMGVVLFLPPVVGLADNGDFSRVMSRVGLAHRSDRYEERYWTWAVTEFAVLDASPVTTDHVTSETLLAAAAVRASRLFARRPVFDIRVLGAIHALLFLGALGLLLRQCRGLAPLVQWLVAGLLVFVFTDVGYIAPFNSLYGQTSSFLALFWLAALAAVAIRRGRAETFTLLGYFVGAAWFVGSKPQECLQAPFLAWYGVRLRAAFATRRAEVAPAIALALGLGVFAVWFYRTIPSVEIHDVGVYHTVFMDLLPSSPDPAADLRALGVDPALARYSGRHAYRPDSPIGDPGFRAAFFDRVGYARVIGFYAARPGRLLDRLERAGRRAFRLRPPNLANLSRASGAPAGNTYRHASTWSRWRLSLGRFGLLWIVLVIGGSLAAAAAGWSGSSRSERLFREGVAVLACMAALEFLVCSLADDLDDLPRHAYLFQAVFDLLLILDAGWLARRWVSARRPQAVAVGGGEDRRRPRTTATRTPAAERSAPAWKLAGL